MAVYTQAQMNKVVRRVRDAVAARLGGATEFTPPGGQTFILNKGGWCNRLVRQAFETALGFEPFQWRYGSPSAKETLTKLKPFILPVGAELKPGDIVGHQRGAFGHIAIYTGGVKGLVAENTSDDERGNPAAAGTKETRLSVWPGKWRAYRLGP